jgi:hypothetical protein
VLPSAISLGPRLIVSSHVLGVKLLRGNHARIQKVSFSVVIILIIVLFAGAGAIPAAAQTDTMQLRYNATHTGDYSAVAGSVQPNNQLKWNYTT